jgi:hypothetical protein
VTETTSDITWINVADLEELAEDLASDPAICSLTLENMDYSKVTLIAGLAIGYASRARAIMRKRRCRTPPM